MLNTERLTKLREQRGMSRKAVADELKLEKSAYGNYELGKRQPSLEMLMKLSSFFGVTPDYLLGGEDNLSSSFRERLSVILENITQTDVCYDAREAGINLEHWGRIVDGEIPVTPKLVRDIADESGVSFEYLIGLADNEDGSFNEEQNEEQKNDTEKLGAALLQIFVDAGRIAPGEEMTDDFRAWAANLVRAAVAFDKARKDGERD